MSINILRKLSVLPTVILVGFVLSGCTKMSFQADPHAAALRIDGGIKIQSPDPMTADRIGLTVSGSCTKGYPVAIGGAGVGSLANSNLDCKDGIFSTYIEFSSGDGIKNVTATQDITSTSQWAQDARDFVKDTTPPIIIIVSPAAGASVPASITISGQCESGLPVNVDVDGVAVGTVSCTNGGFSLPYTLPGADGSKNIVVTQTDAVGNVGTATRTIIKDTVPPAILIAAPANGSYVKSVATISGTCESGLDVAIAGAGVAQAVSAACTNGAFSGSVTFTSGDGSKVVTGSQTDLAGNVGSDSKTYVIDTSIPVVTIDTPAANTSAQTGVTIGGKCQNGISINISGTGVSAPVTATCNNGTYSASINFSSGDGSKNVVASQTSVAGNTGSANRTFIRDTVAPIVAITSPAAGTYVISSATISGTCESGLNVVIAGAGVSQSVIIACTSGNFSSSVSITAGNGSKVVTASQTDAAGNVGSDSKTYITDTSIPVVTIDTPAANTSAQTGVTIGGKCQNGLNINISGTGVSAPLTATCNNGTYSASIVFSSGDGSKNVVASQTTAAGNTGTANRTFIRDTVAPVVAITSPTNGSYIRSPATIAGTCETGLNVVIAGSGVAQSVTAACASGAFTSPVSLTVGDGSKVVTASQTDAAGNVGSDSKTYNVLTTAPVVAITSPVNGSYIRSPATISGTCQSGLNVVIAGAGVAQSVTVACASGAFTSPVSLTVGDGSKVVTASQTDAAGNVGSDSKTYNVLTTAPVVAITSPANGSYVRSPATISGTCETGLNVVIAGSGVAQSVTAACASGAFTSPVSLTVGDGSKVVTASQTDAAGNVGSDSKTYNVLTTAPVVAITSPVNGSYIRSPATISGTCQSGLNVVIAGAGVAQAVAVACASGAFTSPVSLTVGDGSKVVTASQTDAAGNVGSDSKTYNVLTTAPVVAITSPVNGSYIRSPATIGGTCKSGLNVVIAGAGVAQSVTVACASSAFSSSVTLTSGDGSKVVTASQTDAAGNVGSDSKTYNVLTTAPVVAITLPVNGSYIRSPATISGTCKSGLNVVIAGAGVAQSVTVACASSAFSSSVTLTSGDGSKVVTASQTDAAGNIGSDSKTYNVDTMAPVVKITAPAANTYAQTGLELRGTCETGLQVVIYGPGVEGTVQTPCLNATFVQSINFSIGEGAKIVNVSQTDAAGNIGTDSRTFVKDVTPPAIAFTSPAEGTNVKVVGVTVKGTCETGLSVNLMGSGLAASSTTACTNGTFSAAINLSSGDGSKNIIATQTDLAGNVGSAVLDLVLDTVAPAVAITSPTNGASVPASATISGTCESGISVSIAGTGVVQAITAACASGAFSGQVTFTSGAGSKTVSASQVDLAGNVGTDSKTYNLAAAPVIKITAPAVGTQSPSGITLQGTCTNGINVLISGDVSAQVTTSCANGAFSQAITFSSGNGTKNIIASQTDSFGNVGSDQRSFVKGSTNGYDTFNVTRSSPNVDILIIDDNSASMDPDEAKLAQRMAPFVQGLGNTNWQIGITTTDCSSGPYGICGSLLPLSGATGNILTAQTPNYQTVFANTIYRPETVGCVQRGDCPSSTSVPLLSSITAMDKRNTNNAGFFRDGADLAVVIISNADEAQNAPSTATTAQQAQSHFLSIWPTGKNLSVYSIIVRPGDSACLSQEINASGGFAFYGTHEADWSQISGGSTGSICAADYSQYLTSVGQQVNSISNSVLLSHTPIGAVQVVFTPAQNITWTVSGNRVLFSSPPPAGTQIQVYYNY